MELIQDKNSRSGMIGTILVHLLLLLLFVSFGMPYQDPPPVNEGAMMIDFGDSGGGPPSEENSSEENESSSNDTETSESNSSQESVQTTENETIDLNASQNNSEETQETVSENLTNALEALNNANNNSTSNNNNNSNSSNNSSNNSNSTGPNTGSTNGIGFSLGGRGKISFKKPENPTQEDGKVVVDIVVDRNGKVLKAKSGARGSTTTNPILQKKAEEAALKAKFKKDINAPFEQKGTMTFVFILN
ncbi:MAG: hypothetical protein COA97_07485 [Flavobacteriales bacterium]|nr:MAG: hypothetical protein COA97_07485 [Flavobacteriales bacterium]